MGVVIDPGASRDARRACRVDGLGRTAGPAEDRAPVRGRSSGIGSTGRIADRARAPARHAARVREDGGPGRARRDAGDSDLSARATARFRIRGGPVRTRAAADRRPPARALLLDLIVARCARLLRDLRPTAGGRVIDAARSAATRCGGVDRAACRRVHLPGQRRSTLGAHRRRHRDHAAPLDAPLRRLARAHATRHAAVLGSHRARRRVRRRPPCDGGASSAGAHRRHPHSGLRRHALAHGPHRRDDGAAACDEPGADHFLSLRTGGHDSGSLRDCWRRSACRRTRSGPRSSRRPRRPRRCRPVRTPSRFQRPPALRDPGSGRVVHFTTSARRIDCPASSTLLDAAESAGVAISSSCRAGVCQSCRTRLLEGEADCRSDLLDPDDRAAGFILPCVSWPTADCVLEA